MMFSLPYSKIRVRKLMEHAGFHSGEELIVESFTDDGN